MKQPSASSPTPPGVMIDRRTFAERLGFGAMAGGLAASYGTFGWFALRYLFPAGGQAQRWVYVADLRRIEGKDAVAFVAPNGATINIARMGHTGAASDFVALSSTCPHLGCQVHWEAQNKRFFCPCHNGVFDAQGKGISGPPGDAKQHLPRYPIKIENGLLYLAVPDVQLTSQAPPHARPGANAFAGPEGEGSRDGQSEA
jgi:cytochrome b6-f complex iron-sulfur subunit